jgi:putative photosynthetic complex assembly protein 2
MNLLFPVSVTAATSLLAVLVERAGDADATAFEATGAVFLATLVALGLLSTGSWCCRCRSVALWNWGLRSRRRRDRSDPAHSRTCVRAMEVTDEP